MDAIIRDNWPFIALGVALSFVLGWVAMLASGWFLGFETAALVGLLVAVIMLYATLVPIQKGIPS